MHSAANSACGPHSAVWSGESRRHAAASMSARNAGDVLANVAARLANTFDLLRFALDVCHFRVEPVFEELLQLLEELVLLLFLLPVPMPTALTRLFTHNQALTSYHLLIWQRNLCAE